MEMKMLNHLLIHAHDLWALTHFPEFPNYPKYPQGGMTLFPNDLASTEIIAIANGKHWNVNFLSCIY